MSIELMRRNLADYLKALVLCTIAAIGYRYTVVPLVEPPLGPLVEIDDTMQDLSGPDLGDVFAADSWQMQNPKTLRAPWGWLLFQEWKQTAPDRWEVSPVSVVLEDSDKPGGPTEKDGPTRQGRILLDSPDGAIVEFSEPINMMNSATPAIKGGQLLGEVHIYNQRPNIPTEENSSYEIANSAKAESFDLRTRNVRIDNKQIRSAEEVRLSVGDALIVGRDLTIKMAAGGTIPTSVDSPLAVLDSLELIYLDTLQVPLIDGPLWQPIASRAANDDSLPPPVYDSASLSVGCEGRVTFDFATFVLRMTEGVTLRHHWSDLQHDSFACRTLDIQLVNPFATAKTPEESDQNPLLRVSKRLRRIVAQGAPIQAEIPSLGGRLMASEISFLTETGEVELLGGKDRVELVYGDYRFSLPGLKYQINPSDPARPGKMVVDGAGMVSVADVESPLKRFRWQQTLQLLPQQIGYQLWVAGDVQAKMRDGGSVGAGDIALLFDWRQDPTSGRETLRLDKLRARKNVDVNLREMVAKTETVLVLFEHLADSALDTAQAELPSINPASGPRQRQWITGPAGGGKASPDSAVANTVAPVAKPRPKLVGQAITANLTLAGTKIVAQDVSVVKDVILEHELQTARGPLPLVYRGDTLRLMTGLGDDRVQIAGKPARIDLGNGFFEGSMVVVSGQQNLVTITDGGTFQIPLEVLPQGQAAVRWSQPPRCDFKKDLTFDGQLVEINGDVRLTGQMFVGEPQELWDISADAPKLQVQLNNKIQVTSPADAKAAAVERVSLVGDSQGVLLVATKLGPNNELQGRHVLNNPKLDFYATTGQLIGAGPGWYRSWTPMQSDSPMRSVAPPGSLMAAHLIYNGSLEGNLSDQQIAFSRGVRVGMSAVDDWSRMIDAATMTQLTLNQGRVDCDRLMLGVSPVAQPSVSKNPPWEIQALGGVAFEMMTDRGRFDGTAARAAFDARNDLFVLEGSPRSDAIVRGTSPTGQPLGSVRMPSFTLRPDTMEVDMLVGEATLSEIPGRSR